jgi:TQXA domain-containing protein
MDGQSHYDLLPVTSGQSVAKRLLAAFMTLIMIFCIGTLLIFAGEAAASAETEGYNIVYQSPYPMKILRNSDRSAETESAYCINRSVALSGGEAGTIVPLTKTTGAGSDDFATYAGNGSGFLRIYDASGTAEERTASDTYRHVLTVLMNGYPEDRSGLLEGLAAYKGRTRNGHDVYEFDSSLVTQAALWHFTDAGTSENGVYRNYTLQEHVDLIYEGFWDSVTPPERELMQELYDRLIAEDSTGLAVSGGEWTAELDLYRNDTEPDPVHGRWQNLAAVRTFATPDEPAGPVEPETPEIEEPVLQQEETPVIEETSAPQEEKLPEKQVAESYEPPTTSDQSGIPLYMGLFAAAGAVLAAMTAVRLRKR